MWDLLSGTMYWFWDHLTHYGAWGGVIFAVGWSIKAALGVIALRWLRDWRLRRRALKEVANDAAP